MGASKDIEKTLSVPCASDNSGNVFSAPRFYTTNHPPLAGSEGAGAHSGRTTDRLEHVARGGTGHHRGSQVVA